MINKAILLNEVMSKDGTDALVVLSTDNDINEALDFIWDNPNFARRIGHINRNTGVICTKYRTVYLAKYSDLHQYSRSKLYKIIDLRS